MRARWLGRSVRRLMLGAVCLLAAAAASAGAELTGVDGLVKVYDAILDARFEQADAELTRACPPAPREACDVLAATRTWWRIQLDPESRALDAAFTAEVERAIASTEAWAAREPQNAEAHFYTGGAYAVRVQWRVLRHETLAAAKDGKRIKQALDRAIALDPGLDDAYFGVGLYQYYADVAPAAAKVFRFLLMLPGGNKTEGLARMRRAREHGRLLQGEADYQLQLIDLWYERRADLAVDRLESLRDRHPGNPIFAAQLADVQDRYLHDLTASLATWRALLADARAGRVNAPDLAETQARLGSARMLEALCESDAARESVRAVVDARPARPFGALATAYLALGEIEDRLGHRDAAVDAYRRAVAESDVAAAGDVRSRALERMRRAPDPVRAEAYRLSLEGWRALEAGRTAEAEPRLARAVALDPRDPVARYRYARVLQTAHRDTAALAEYEAALAGAQNAPAPIAAAAFLDAARLEERLALRDRAQAHYDAASTWFGGGAETRAAAARALRRLHAVK